jgi:hypothetical protein
MGSKPTDYLPETAAPKKHNGGNCKLNFSALPNGAMNQRGTGTGSAIFVMLKKG